MDIPISEAVCGEVLRETPNPDAAETPPQRLQCVVVHNFMFQKQIHVWAPMPVASLFAHIKSERDPVLRTMSEQIGKDMPHPYLRRIAIDCDGSVPLADHTMDYYNDFKTKHIDHIKKVFQEQLGVELTNDDLAVGESCDESMKRDEETKVLEPCYKYSMHIVVWDHTMDCREQQQLVENEFHHKIEGWESDTICDKTVYKPV